MKAEEPGTNNKSLLINFWLRQQSEDSFVDQQRTLGQTFQASGTHYKGRDMKQISEKLNRLERNFLRQKQVKRETKASKTTAESIVQLDRIYQITASLIAMVEESEKQETKQALGQIISLYNHSAAEIANRQRLEKQIRSRSTKLDAINAHRRLVQGQKQKIQEYYEQIKAQHWLRLSQYTGIKAQRQ